MKLGLIVRHAGEIEEELNKVQRLGFSSCQIQSWFPEMFTSEAAAQIKGLLAEREITLSTFWCGWSGPRVWNFYEGQTTLGLIPAEYRAQRVADLKLGAEFAARMGATQMATHAGFLPEDPTSQLYADVVQALREVAQHAKDCGLKFLFETGQETPVTLRRVIEDIGTGNLGVNYDPANLVLYGKANPIDALSCIGEYICDLHAKDGCYPTDGRSLGKQMRLGEGVVDFAALIAYLKGRGYDGAITIEREISGEQQITDILDAKKFLEELWG